MARRPRLQFPGAVYHVMSRGNRKLPIFEDDVDRQLLLAVIGEAASRYDVTIYAGCLMGNHYHFVLDTPRGNLSSAMQYINGVFSQASNERHGRTGHLFEARFLSKVVQDEFYFRLACRYVVLNPVKHGFASDAAAWRWSTYRATAGLENPPAWLCTDWIEWAFESQSKEDAQQKYRLYVSDPTALQLDIDANKWALGTQTFTKAMEQRAKEIARSRSLGATFFSPARASLATIYTELRPNGRNRDEIIAAAHIEHGYSLAEIGTFLRLHRSTVSKAFRRLHTRNPLPKGGR